MEREGSFEPLPSLVTQQGDMTSRVWLNGEFHTRPWTLSKAPESPQDQIENEVSDIESDFPDSESEGT